MSEAMPNATTEAGRSIGHLLAFIAPGLVHGLGNSLFAIRGAAHVLGFSGGDRMRSQRVVVEAADQAEVLLETLRYLSGVDPARPTGQPGVLLERLAKLIRIPLRDSGLRVEIAHGSHDTPVLVDACAFTRAVCEVVAALGASVPRGLEGAIELDLAAQGRGAARIDVTLAADASFLPFPNDVGSVVDALRDVLAADGVRISRQARDQLSLELG